MKSKQLISRLCTSWAFATKEIEGGGIRCFWLDGQRVEHAVVADIDGARAAIPVLCDAWAVVMQVPCGDGNDAIVYASSPDGDHAMQSRHADGRWQMPHTDLSEAAKALASTVSQYLQG